MGRGSIPSASGQIESPLLHEIHVGGSFAEVYHFRLSVDPRICNEVSYPPDKNLRMVFSTTRHAADRGSIRSK
jgi:hypothetical protein